MPVHITKIELAATPDWRNGVLLSTIVFYKMKRLTCFISSEFKIILLKAKWVKSYASESLSETPHR